ncbi:MAG: tetratricopeptide repeat protein [Sulfuricurvum sp.]|uniref:tetratricopeptide repeat protein n=1 Tax=Sulfuricurvum sp. TaxID=2025608 RepID=UPI002610E0FB|nr:tetratricopeptide repeat protein [Sulfuricurvum sp.]MDD2829364.1 tetratricopeptide repeat protein [Sulfuricurvum sp.]MDD4949144.1 tetratricopeptide repeat protein [Sulfuricurvum sp.]
MKHLVLAMSLLMATVPTFAGIKEAKAAMQKEDFATAIKEWTALANKGNAEAQFNLGVIYGAGLGTESNMDKAIGWYNKAATQNHPEAAYIMSIAYAKGQGIKEDKTASMQWLKKAAELGSARAQNSLGDDYFDGIDVAQNRSTAFYLYKKAAEQGNADAQRNMGYVYSNGQGAEQNDQEAIKWYTLAAKQELVIAYGELGGIYMKLKDYKQGMYWLQKGSESGDNNAQRQYGVGYFLGDGVPENKAEGFKWVFLAVETGHDENAYDLEAKLVKMMTPEQVEEGKRLAMKWLNDHGYIK